MKRLLPAVFLLLPLTVFAQIDVAPPDGPGCPPACVPPPTIVTARAVTTTTPWNTPLWIRFLGSTTGTGPLVYATSSDPLHGSLGTILSDTVLYTPAARYAGVDEFSYSAADGAFISGIASVAIEVTDPIDTSAPIFSTPINQTFATTTFPAQPTLIPPSISDDLDTDPQLAYSPLLFPLGTTTVTWTATDISGNSVATTSLVLITDATPPEPEPIPSPGPVGNGPPVGYVPAPFNPPAPAPPVPPAPQPNPEPDSAGATEASGVASVIRPTSSAQVAVSRTAIPSQASTNVPIAAQKAATKKPATIASQQTVPTAQSQIAAAAGAIPAMPKAYDYIGLLILFALVLLAAIYEWRRERRSTPSDL